MRKLPATLASNSGFNLNMHLAREKSDLRSPTTLKHCWTMIGNALWLFSSKEGQVNSNNGEKIILKSCSI